MGSNGVYGTNVGARVDIAKDVEIFYSFSPSRANTANMMDYQKLDSSLLFETKIDSATSSNRTDGLIEGLYNLKLPLHIFNTKGYYNVIIKPKEHFCTLTSVGVLSSFPDVRGLVLDSSSRELSEISDLLRTNNALVGYRIIYFDENGNRENYYRVVTSNNKCEPVVQNLTDVNTASIRYRFNESSSLTFLTVTPSTSTNFKPNAEPYIGKSMQRIALVNTKFEPLMLDIEMVENDFDTLSTMISGSQLRNLENGLVTTYNRNNEIVLQHEHFNIKENGKDLYNVKINKGSSIDFSETLEDKI